MARVDVRKGKEKSVRQLQKTLALALIVSLMSGCTTLRPVSSEPKEITAVLRPGDDVRVTTRDGRVVDITVKEITERSISGEEEQVAVSDIVQIDRREFSPGKTAGMIGVLAMTAILIYGTIFIASALRTGM